MWEALTPYTVPLALSSVLRGTAVLASKASPRADRFLRRLFLWSHLLLIVSLRRKAIIPDTSLGQLEHTMYAFIPKTDWEAA